MHAFFSWVSFVNLAILLNAVLALIDGSYIPMFGPLLSIMPNFASSIKFSFSLLICV